MLVEARVGVPQGVSARKVSLGDESKARRALTRGCMTSDEYPSEPSCHQCPYWGQEVSWDAYKREGERPTFPRRKGRGSRSGRGRRDRRIWGSVRGYRVGMRTRRVERRQDLRVARQSVGRGTRPREEGSPVSRYTVTAYLSCIFTICDVRRWLVT